MTVVISCCWLLLLVVVCLLTGQDFSTDRQATEWFWLLIPALEWSCWKLNYLALSKCPDGLSRNSNSYNKINTVSIRPKYSRDRRDLRPTGSKIIFRDPQVPKCDGNQYYSLWELEPVRKLVQVLDFVSS